MNPRRVEVAGSAARQEWPEYGLDVSRLATGGWHPVPFREFVLKVHSRCNLACDYCYVYRAADQSWRARPRTMARETLRATVRRIAEHAGRHGLAEVRITLHGGEPLMAGPGLLGFAAEQMRAAAPPGCRVKVSVQTNGILLTERTLDALAAHDVGVAVSLDGDRVAHNRHRRHADGRGSHASVMHGLRLLTGPYRKLFHGVLCTVDLANDPLTTYQALLEANPPRLDLLLPHGTWAAPPPAVDPFRDDRTPYADWLITVFDRWYRAPRRETGIRLFEEIINVLLGGRSRSESVGLSPVAVMVVDTDGTLQQVDTLKMSYAGAPETGLTVAEHSFDEALRHPGVVARQIGLSALSETCLRCPVHKACGGGSYVHRYRPGHGFRNPSVYCSDLRRLIEHIGREVHGDLARLMERPR